MANSNPGVDLQPRAVLQIASAVGILLLAFGQPVFDLIRLHPTFLTAHHASMGDVALLSLAVVGFLSLPLTAVLGVACLLGRGALRFAISLTHAASVAALGLYTGSQLTSAAPAGFLVYAIVVATTLLLIVMSPALRRVSHYAGTLALFAIPVTFLVLVLPHVVPVSPERDSHALERIRYPSHVFVLILDGFRAVDIMDGEGQVRAGELPGFAELARDAIWFRNATTVAGFTHRAVPAILTGQYPDPATGGRRPTAPTASEYPHNIFSLLSGTYGIRAHEPITRMCSYAACDVDLRPAGVRRRSLLSDTLVLWWASLSYLHGTDPDQQIRGKWKGFPAKQIEGPESDRLKAALAFVTEHVNESRPTLRVLHTLLPHKPFEYVANGKRYAPPQTRLDPVSEGYVWNADEQLVAFEHERYRQQVRAADAIVQSLIDSLKEQGLYEETIVVVTADHGVSFKAGVSHRNYSAEAREDIVRVPLFLKLPGEARGRVDDRPAQTVDILPTILDLLGTESSMAAGTSLLLENMPFRERVFYRENGAKEVLPGHWPVSSHGKQDDRLDVGARSSLAKSSDGMPTGNRSGLDVVYERNDALEEDVVGPVFLVGAILPRELSGLPDSAVFEVEGREPIATRTYASEATGRLVMEALLAEATPNTLTRLLLADDAGHPLATSVWNTLAGASHGIPSTAVDRFWFRFWRGHHASVDCSAEYRREFVRAWKNTGERLRRGEHSLPALVGAAHRRCESLHGIEPCGCSWLTSEVVGRVGEEAVATPQDGFWQQYWGAAPVVSECPSLVRQAFQVLYQVGSSQGFPRPPFFLLRSAIAELGTVEERAEVAASRSGCGRSGTMEGWDAGWRETFAAIPGGDTRSASAAVGLEMLELRAIAAEAVESLDR